MCHPRAGIRHGNLVGIDCANIGVTEPRPSLRRKPSAEARPELLSTRPLSPEHHFSRLEQDEQVEDNIPMLYIIQIVLQLFPRIFL